MSIIVVARASLPRVANGCVPKTAASIRLSKIVTIKIVRDKDSLAITNKGMHCRTKINLLL